MTSLELPTLPTPDVLPDALPRYVVVPDPLTGLHRILRREDGTPISQPRPLPTLPTGSRRPPPWLRLDVTDTLRRRGLYRKPPEKDEAEQRARDAAPTAAQLRRWREDLGWSQRELAERARCSRGIVAGVELGQRHGAAMRERLGDVLRAAVAVVGG